MPSAPLVSVIMPIYNGERYLREAIDSVLAQDYATWELLMVDDGSHDGTAAILASYAGEPRLRVLRHPDGANRGVSQSRRLAVQAATGEFLALLDADDVCEPARLRQQVAAFGEQPDAVICHSALTIIDHADEPFPHAQSMMLGNDRQVYQLLDLLTGSPWASFCNSTIMARTAVARQVPWMPQQLYQVEDAAFWFLMAEKGRFIYLPTPLVRYRFHPGSFTYSWHGDDLKAQHGALELHLCLLALAATDATRAYATTQVRAALARLAAIYGAANAAPVDGKAIDRVFSADVAESLRLHQRCKDLQQRLYDLEHSRVWRLAQVWYALKRRLLGRPRA